VHNPSLTVYRPVDGTANGSAVIILPGGGHSLLVINSEGRDAAQFMAKQGVTAFVLRYRLFREENSPYVMDDARADIERAVRLVRSKADNMGLDKDRIGVMAFSAGGELARPAMLSPPVAIRGQGDVVDTLSARPDFGILIYPGPLKAEQENVTKDSPALFMVAANDDACCSSPVLELARLYNIAKASAELHLYSEGGHAFNMGKRTELDDLSRWPDRLLDWMKKKELAQ